MGEEWACEAGWCRPNHKGESEGERVRGKEELKEREGEGRERKGREAMRTSGRKDSED